MIKVETYFVLNGLLDGERGIRALTCGHEEQQRDGWYWALEGMDDGEGPYTSREDAMEAGTQDLERYKSIGRGGIERHWIQDENDSADTVYSDAYTFAVDAILNNPLSKSCPNETAQIIARELAQNIAQP